MAFLTMGFKVGLWNFRDQSVLRECCLEVGRKGKESEPKVFEELARYVIRRNDREDDDPHN